MRPLKWQYKITSMHHETRLYNCDPLKPHFYIVKLAVYIIFLISLKNIDCGYSLEPPRRGGSNEYPQSMFWAEIWKDQRFLSEYFQFLEMKFSTYLHRCVFVMNMEVYAHMLQVVHTEQNILTAVN